MSKKHLFVATLAMAALGCGAANAADPDPRRGEKVDRICFADSLSGFEVPDGYKNAVVLTRGVRDRYLVKLMGPGLSSLKFAQAFGVDTRRGGGCLSRGDRLVFADSVFSNDRLNRTSYTITAIYRWDDKAAAPDQEADQDDA